jgi:hypothetical protein
MKTVDRVAEILSRAPFEELIRERDVSEAGTVLRLSKGEVYRKVASRVLGHLKVDGARRRGHGRAGRVTFLLEHLVRYQVERECPAGQGPRAVETAEPVSAAGGGGST